MSSVFGDLLLKFCDDHDLILADKCSLPADSYTYLSPAWGTTSWLDHIMCTHDALSSITNISVVHDCIISDHFPLSFNFNMDIVPVCMKHVNNDISCKINWDKLSLNQIEMYRLNTNNELGDITVPDGVKCLDPNCGNHCHQSDIDGFYMNIVNVLCSCSEKFKQAHKPNNHHNVPGWNDQVEPYHNAARDAYSLWREVGKPRNGPIHDLMKQSRCKFKYMLRKCRRDKNTVLADKLAEQFHNKSDKEFWRNIKNKMNSKVNLPTMIDNVKGDAIPEMWKKHYDSVFNCVNGSNCADVHNDLCGKHINYDQSMVVSAQEIVLHKLPLIIHLEFCTI